MSKKNKSNAPKRNKHNYSGKCSTGKRRFKTDVDAKIVLSRIQWKDNASRKSTEKRSYHCPICNGYHLTSKPLRQAPTSDT